MSLTAAFLAAVDPARHGEANGIDLESRLASIIVRAREEWPGIAVDPALFATRLGERVPGDSGLEEALASMNTGDLWLVCACAEGNARAIAAFERAYFAEIASAVRRVSNPTICEDDVAQLVREKLFVGTGERPKILDYRGHGPVRAWLRVTASRVALNLATRGPREKPADNEWFARIVSDADQPEIQHLKTKYRADFRAALEAAVDGLEPKERNLLAYVFNESLTIDQIGGIYGVHRATAGRWIAAAQKKLVEQTRTTLAHRLGASANDVNSIVHLIASRFDVSLGRILGDNDDSGA